MSETAANRGVESTCSADGHYGAPAAPLALAEALARFSREARRGSCDTGRYRCRYYSWGTGPALLFVPGLSDDAESFVLPAALLSGRFRCIAYDFPSGRDDGARLANYTHADFVDDVRALLDHLGIQQSYLFGSSFGSTITLEALRTMPERFPRAVLQGGFAYRPLAPAEVALAWVARFWPGSMRHLPLRRAVLRRSHFAPFVGRPADDWEYFMTRCGTPPIAAVARRALILHRLDLRSQLPEVKQPVLLVCGDGDPLVGPQCTADLRRGLPHAEQVDLPDCGHCPQFSHPELLAEVVLRFLTSTMALSAPAHANRSDA